MKAYRMKEIGKQTLEAVIEHLDNVNKVPADDYKIELARIGTGSRWKDIAGEIYSFMPSHYFKFLHVLEKEQLETVIKNLEDITILDIGCGMGTVTHCINDYIKNKLPKKKIDIMCIGLEPCDKRGELFEVAFATYIDTKVNYEYIQGSFPKDVEKALGKIRNNNVFVCTSNLLNWIRDRQGNIDTKKVIVGINKIFKALEDKDVWMINSEMDKENRNMLDALSEIYTDICQQPMYFSKYEIVASKSVSFLNPKNSLAYDVWKKRGRYVLPTEYHYIYTQVNSIGDIVENAVKKTGDFLSTLRICDELEWLYIKSNKDIKKLFVNYIKEEKLGNNYNEYVVSKPNGEKRYILEEDMLDTIYETIILMNKGILADRQQIDAISYGNRLDGRLGKSICIPYGKMYYKKYMPSVKEIIDSKRYSTYFEIDISKYYNSIDHKKLLEIIGRKYKYLEGFVRGYLNRRYKGCTYNEKGIPQGPEMSALLANIYMGEFDEWFNDRYPQNKLLRYVDDVIVFVKNSEKDNVERIRSNVIRFLKNELLLEINKEKSSDIKKKTSQYYKAKDNEYYEQIQKRISYILNTIYYGMSKVLDDNDLKLNDKNIRLLQEKMGMLGIWIPLNEFAAGIQRQLKMLNTTAGKFKRWRKAIKWILDEEIVSLKVVWGSFNDGKEVWYKNFKNNNKGFVKEINSLQQEIYKEIKITLRGIESASKDKDKYIKRLKYLYNRAEVFRIPDDDEVIIKILEVNPLVSGKKLLHYPKTVEKLLEEVNYKDLNVLDLYKIWLMGEVKGKENIERLIEWYKWTFEAGLGYQNTIITEALLKKAQHEQLEQDIFDYCIKELRNGNKKEYVLVRNALFILNTAIDEVDNIIDEVYEQYKDTERTKVLIEWIKENTWINILNLRGEEIEYDLNEEYGEGYELLRYIEGYMG